MRFLFDRSILFFRMTMNLPYSKEYFDMSQTARLVSQLQYRLASVKCRVDLFSFA